MGSNYYPWGPHGERVSPFEVKPNPTPSTPQPFGPPDFAPPAANPYRAASTGEYTGNYVGTYTPYGIARLGNFVVSVVVVGFLWQFFVCLYPLPALAAGVTAIYSAGFLVKHFPPDPVFLTSTFLCVLAAYAAGIAVLYFATRIEERLARHAWYRIPRHLVRLALFALMAIFAIERASGIPMLGAVELSVISSNIARILRTPDYLIAVFVFVAIMHVMLWKAERLRAFWHRRLAGAGLMKS
ncbi:MAG: hypothetical protein ACRD59_15275 [Candidatus Acidiferrales bacterium]